MAQRILHNNLQDKVYDHVLISMGPIEHDARMLNIAQTLQHKYSDILLVGLFTPNWQVSCEHIHADVLLMENYIYSPMFRLWTGYYRWLRSVRDLLKGRSYWAMDLFVLPFVTRISSKIKSQSIYDSREVYSALGEASEHPVKQKVITFIEKRYIRKADKVFTSGPLDSKHLADIYKITLPDIVLNLPRYKTCKKTDLLRETFHISKDKKILIYQGVINRGRGLKQVVRALTELPDFALCLLGNGTTFQDELSKLSFQLEVNKQVFFHESVPYQELLTWTSSADLGFCFIEPLSLSLKYALPNKLFEYAMAGIPSLISDLPQMTPYVDKYDCGVILSSNADVTSFIQNIKKATEPEIYNRMRQNALVMAKEMNWESQQEVVFRLAANNKK